MSVSFVPAHEYFILFWIYPNIDQYFQKSAEKLTDCDKKHDISWYFARIGVDAKIKKGKPFIEDRIEMFNRAEAKHGIHKELIAAIIGVETNFPIISNAVDFTRSIH